MTIVQLKDLERRLAEAKGPSTDLDKKIFVTIDVGFDARVTGHAFTASLDAAVSMVGRVLWGRGLLIGKGRCRPNEPLWGVQILASDENEDQREMPVIAEAEHDTAALALCLACVRALIAQGEK